MGHGQGALPLSKRDREKVLREDVRDLARPATDKQKQREVLRAYASSPPGTSIVRVLAQCRISRPVWVAWKRDPVFKNEFEEIQYERGTIDMGPFETFLGAINKALINKALTGDVGAIRTVYELMGRISKPTVNVNTNVGVGVNTVQTAGDVEALVARTESFIELAQRHRERLRLARANPDLAGLETDAGDPPAGS